MLIAAVPDPSGGVRLRVDDGPVEEVTDFAARVRAAGPDARWLWPSTAECYPRLVRAGVRVARCHDLELTEALLLGYEGRWGEPRTLPAVWARLTGAPVPPDPPARPATPPGDGQATLFDPEPPPAGPGLDALLQGYRHQQARIDATADPARFRFLVAAEAAGALLAVEMGAAGLPWRADVHDELLRELLGEPSPMGGPPRRLADLSARIAAAFGGQRVHPESPAEVLRALQREGISVPSTRAWVLRGVDHPAIPLLLEYKELYRIWTAHGWSWCQQWVRDGRFHPEFVPAGVVSGRWATRGGGALQIPKVIRKAVVADPGWTFVVADAGQLEPRILAAVSGDPGMSRAAGAGDMYAALATESFGGDRATAKVALLGAMYGQVGGQAAPALATLRRSYPQAWAYVEDAARVGEAGGLVRSWLGRTCPAGSAFWDLAAEASARARGRFTRNFVIQATAAEWALALLALLRADLAGTAGPADLAGAELVFFQHDEVVVHAPVDKAPEVAALVEAAGERTRRLLFGDTPVRFPLGVSIVDCYADAK
ncbi:MAG: bifunctional 3'-5' exonuclease/DNA polymerase [Actinobacteria bacterium 13_1_20CM_3_71_11]|nr:MAG: bifunctional 3'-5' exonuclease/DNA polymerase [Actinobacteria bacterium 13_1_20CM_3_71_11]